MYYLNTVTALWGRDTLASSTVNSKSFDFLHYVFFLAVLGSMWNLVLQPGSNPCHLQWKRRVLTGPPGNSQAEEALSFLLPFPHSLLPVSQHILIHHKILLILSLNQYSWNIMDMPISISRSLPQATIIFLFDFCLTSKLVFLCQLFPPINLLSR